MKKKFFLFLLILPVTMHFFSLFFLHFNGNFRPKDFEHGFPRNAVTDVHGLDFSKLDLIFSQPFHYLSRGKQMIAFESDDKKYVLKLFNPMRPLKKRWYLHLKYWKQYSSVKWIFRERFQKKIRLKKLFHRHKLAYELLKKETGLIFVHLSPSKEISHYVHLKDHRGKNHTVYLHHTPFVLQEKADLVPHYLQKLILEKKFEEAQSAIHALETLFEKRLEVGITDRIQTMGNNYGFVENKPIQIDVGRIRFDEEIKKNPQEERSRILQQFHEYLKNEFSVLY